LRSVSAAPQVCRQLGEQLYIEEEGARAIVSGVRQEVDAQIKDAMLEGALPAEGGTVRMVAAHAEEAVFDLHFGSGDI
jgi:ATP-dependent Clp protease ATP-binding subunit ClpA